MEVVDRPSLGSQTILVAEDEHTVRHLVCRILQRHGYHMLDAASGEAAMLLCEEHRGPIHLLLTDLVMPGMNGRQLAECVSARRNDTKVLFMSGHTSDTVVKSLLDQGTPFLQKPFTPDALVRTVRDQLDTPTLSG